MTRHTTYRPPGRRWGSHAVVAATLGALLIAGAAGAATGVLSIGDVIPGDTPSAHDPTRLAVDELVVAQGTSRVGGPWRITSYESEQSAGQPAGLPCLRLVLELPPEGTPINSSGFCGEVSEGFGAVSLPVVDQDGRAELLIFGVAPESSTTVRLTSASDELARARTYDGPSTFPRGDVFVVAVEDASGGGHLTFADDAGRVGSKKLDASGFFERLRAVERIGAG